MNADRKQAEEILQKHFRLQWGHDGSGEFMKYIIDAMQEFAQLSSPLPEITEEEIKARALKETEIYEKMLPYGARINIILEDMAVWALDLIKLRLSERKEQKTTNFMQVQDLSHEEEFEMYMKCSKEELITMLLENQRLLKAFKGEPAYVTETIYTDTTRPYGCWNCGIKECGNYGSNIGLVCAIWINR